MRLRETSNVPLPADIRELTSVRFLAAMWVVLLHFGFELDGGYGPLAPFAARGDLGVDLFFILSGFILTHVYFAGYAKGAFSWLRFVVYRFGRIYPLHVATLAMAIVIFLVGRALGLAGTPEADWGQLPSQMLMIHAWGVEEHAAWNDPSWSISAEWFAYLTTPLFFAILVAFAGRPALLTLVATIAFLAIYHATIAVAGKPPTLLITDFSMVRIVPEFLLGCALQRLSAAITLTRGTAMLSTAAATATGIGAIYLAAPDLIVVLAQGGVIFGLSQLAKHRDGTLMRARWPVYLGEISYAVYMVHALVDRVYFTGLARLTGAAAHALPLLLWLGALPALILAAAVCHHVIEIPGRRLVRRWADRIIPARHASAKQGRR